MIKITVHMLLEDTVIQEELSNHLEMKAGKLICLINRLLRKIQYCREKQT